MSQSHVVQDKRRSARYPHQLRVDVQTRHGPRSLVSRDVSRHGLFLVSPDPLKERHVIQLHIHLPQGPTLDATAWVSRSTPEGAGVQLFTLSAAAKAAWDGFFLALAGQRERSGPTRAAIDQSASAGGAAASFVVKFKDLERLREFTNNSVEAGGTFLVTPVLRAIGTPVQMIMVHPSTDEEFIFTGDIVRLNQATPKGIEIRFRGLDDARKQAFRTFIDTGHYLPQSLDDAWSTVSGDEAWRELLPSEDEASGDELQVVVGRDLAEDEKFDWDEVGEEFMIDLDIGHQVSTDIEITDDLVVEESAAPPAPAPLTTLPSPADPEIELDPDRDADIDLSPDVDRMLRAAVGTTFQVRVMCSGCDGAWALTLGSAPGRLGAVARMEAFWDPGAVALLSVPRLRPAKERFALRESLDDAVLDAPVPLAVAFEVAALSGPPRNPETQATLKNNDAAKAVRAAAAHIDAGDARYVDTEATCPSCGEGVWTVVRR